MKKFKNFALKRPFIFGIALLFIYAMLSTLAYPVHFLFPENEMGQLYGDAVAKLFSFLIFLGVLWRFGWIRASGIARLGKPRIWPLIAVLLAYFVLIELYAFTGSVSIAFPNPPLARANLALALSTSLVEETMYRGLVLIAMLQAWGSTKQGIGKAVFFSSLIFGLVHLVNLMIRPVGVVLFQALAVALPGILSAALVLTSRSLWPAILLHWLGNASVNIKLTGYENYQETMAMWVNYVILLIPLIAYSVYVIWKLPEARKEEFRYSVAPAWKPSTVQPPGD